MQTQSREDTQFLREVGIARAEAEPRWMNWRAGELEQLRKLCETQGDLLAERQRDAERWKLIAFAGWWLVILAGLSPLISRWTQ
jgi:hypothetical protein